LGYEPRKSKRFLQGGKLASQGHNIASFRDASSILPAPSSSVSVETGRLYQFPDVTANGAHAETERPDGVGCARAIRLVLAFEALVGVGGLLIWNFWHLLR
jgi:hypothetical protein